MDVLHYLDKETPEVTNALQHGFRRGDADAVGRALREEIQARQTLVKQLANHVGKLQKQEHNFQHSQEVLKNLEEKYRKCRNEISDVKKTQESLNVAYNAKEVLDEVKAQVASHQTSLAEVKAQVASHQTSLAETNTAINQIVNHINAKDQQINDNFAALETKLEEADEKIEDLIATLSNLFQGLSRGSSTLPE